MNPDATWPDVSARPPRTGAPWGWKRLLSWSLIGLWVALCAAQLVFHRARTVSQGYEFARASAEERRMLDEQRSLQLEEASLRSPLRVGVVAAQRIGLRPPAPQEIRRIVATAPKGVKAP